MRALTLITLCCLPLSGCKPNKTQENRESSPSETTETVRKASSEELAKHFPLLPLIEPHQWQQLLAAEAVLEDGTQSDQQQSEAQDQITKITQLLRAAHPFHADPSSIELGGIRFDRTSRQITLPAEVIYPTQGDKRHPGELELILCSTTGRAHETLFITKARPLHLEVILHLAGFKKSTPMSTFGVHVSIPNHDPIPIETLIRSTGGDTLPNKMIWEFSGGDFNDLYPPDQTGDFLICWHAHDSVLRIRHEKIASGEIKLTTKKHPLLEKGTQVTIIIAERAP
ncbi:MAG: hypothetical protein ACPG6P_00375 [Akkermansiaceae bacterium]